MTVRVGLENYTVMAKHGYYEFEHEQDQPFVFTVMATLNHEKVDNNLALTLNYADLQIAIDHVMFESEKPIALMEEMASRVIDHHQHQRLGGDNTCPNRKAKRSTSAPMVASLSSRSNGLAVERAFKHPPTKAILWRSKSSGSMSRLQLRMAAIRSPWDASVQKPQLGMCSGVF